MESVISLLEAVPYLRAYAGQCFVVKAGGELVGHAGWRSAISRDVAVLHRLGIRVVFVHGGGPQLDDAAAARGLTTERVGGRRITCASLVDEAVRCWGAVSSDCVRALSSQGERAMGMSGADGGLLSARRRPPRVVTDERGRRVPVDFGRVGDVVEVRTDVLDAVLGLPAIPVITPLAVGAQGELLNVNADTVAAEVAVAVGAAKLVLITRAPGILSDPADPRTVVHWGDLATLDHLETAGVLSGGMRPKVAAIRRALSGGVPRVHVVDGRRPGSLLEEIFTNAGSGSLIISDGEASSPGPVGPEPADPAFAVQASVRRSA